MTSRRCEKQKKNREEKRREEEEEREYINKLQLNKIYKVTIIRIIDNRVRFELFYFMAVGSCIVAD